jgi:hypothetical protein
MHIALYGATNRVDPRQIVSTCGQMVSDPPDEAWRGQRLGAGAWFGSVRNFFQDIIQTP